MPWINLSKKEINDIIQYMQYSFNNHNRFCFIVKKLKKYLTPIKISSRKGKGRELQKWICEKISKLINIPYNQSDDQCLIHSREMGQKGADIILRGKALKLFPFSIECKSSEQFNIRKAIEQAKSNKLESVFWMVVYKNKSFKKPVIIIDWKAFEYLCINGIDYE
jgi:hypothetical protein